ncbi:MAG TPA: circadian clock KaiB family protein [Cytophagaceae bacterium]|jgi:circadian clock protein KaiB|nr:circadian clock KaiB family protein [Cytophagaceae bacterium]
MEIKPKFILFISGMSVKSIRAIENIKNIAEEHLNGHYELEIIDLSKDKAKTMEFQIFVLPTLIKREPKPVRTFLGDLSNKEKILKILEIK